MKAKIQPKFQNTCHRKKTMAEANLRQRRGKQPGGKKNGGSIKEESTGADEPIEQLRNAQQRLMVSYQRTADLHKAWRAQMFRLSLLIVFVSFHQLQSGPVSKCITDIKQTNEVISGLKAVKLIFADSFCEFLGVIISSLLAYFLALSKDTPLELDAWQYVASSAFVPPCLGFYFHSKQLGCTGNIDDSSPTRQFPVVVIYHTIVTFAFWFMKSGLQQCEDHVKLVNQSIKDFQRMDEKIKKKQQLREKAAKKRQS